jgi:predicted membrane protein
MSLWTFFWGSFFILIGVNFFLQAVGIDLPVFRIVFALAVIWIGVGLLFSKRRTGEWLRINSTSGRDTVFSESKLSGPELSGEYKVAFGSNDIDLSQVTVGDTRKDIQVSVVFGQSKIKIDRTKPVKLTGLAAFSVINTPKGSSTAFGTLTYMTDSYREGAPALDIAVKSAFGRVEVE